MFACIYCPDDKSLVVIGEKSKKLELLGGFQEKAHVKLTWGKTVYDGTIVRIGEDEESLSRFANLANKKVLKNSHAKEHGDILETLYSLQMAESHEVGKRSRQPVQVLPDSDTNSEAETAAEGNISVASSHLLTQFASQRKDSTSGVILDKNGTAKGKGTSKCGKGTGKTGAKGSGTGKKGAQGSGSGGQAGQGSGSVGQTGEGSGSSKQTGGGSGSGRQMGEGSGSGGKRGEGSGSGRHAGEGSGEGGQTGEGSGSGGQAGQGSGSVGQTGEGSGSNRQMGEGSGSNRQTGEGSGEGGQTGEGSGSGGQAGQGSGEGSGSNRQTGEGSGSNRQTGENWQTGEGSGSNRQTGEGSGEGGQTGEGSGSGRQTGEGSGSDGKGYRGRSKQRLPFNADRATSLTSTWSLCTGNRRPPSPPKAVLEFFRALGDPDVQNYVSDFVQFHEEQEEMWTDDHEALNYTALTHPQTQHQQNINYSSNMPAPHSFSHQLNSFPIYQQHTVNQGQMQFMPHASPLAPVQITSNPAQHQYTQHMTTQETLSDTNPQTPFQTPSDHNRTPFQIHHHTSSDQNPQTQFQMHHETPSDHNPQTPFQQHHNTQSDHTPHLNTHSDQSPLSSPSLRRSPRKHVGTTSEDSSGMVRLLTKYDVKVDARQLRKAARAALHATSQKAGYKLASKVVKLLFTTRELANSCGQGLRVKKDDVRPPLDPHMLDVTKEYITAWCRTNGKEIPKDSEINDAVTEQVSYARKQIRTA